MRKFEEIQEEIKQLRDIKPRIPSSNFFNENPQDAVDAQITVLEESMDEDAVEEKYGDGDDNVRSAAMDAIAWRNEEHESDSLVGDWKPLAK